MSLPQKRDDIFLGLPRDCGLWLAARYQTFFSARVPVPAAPWSPCIVRYPFQAWSIGTFSAALVALLDPRHSTNTRSSLGIGTGTCTCPFKQSQIDHGPENSQSAGFEPKVFRYRCSALYLRGQRDRTTNYEFFKDTLPVQRLRLHNGDNRTTEYLQEQLCFGS